MIILDKTVKLSKPQSILFDWDNTLLDSLELIHVSMRDTFSKFKLSPLSKKDLLKHASGSSKIFIEKYFPGESHNEVRKVFLDLYDQFSKEKLALLPKAREALEEVKKKDIKMAIVSNKAAVLLSMELAKLGLDKYFSSIVGSGDLAEDKPSPLPVLKALKDIGIRPSHKVWFVGDSATDMAAAHNSQCLPVFFGDDDYTSEHYKHCQPKLHFPNHAELIKYFSSLK